MEVFWLGMMKMGTRCKRAPEGNVRRSSATAAQRDNSGVTKTDRVQKFKNMLLNGDKYEEIYNSNKKLFNSMQITDEGKFKLLLESQNTTHHFFNFIEVF